ncbi:hypothetical protein BVY03_01925 [bacterium K02(2017)]|nr:hypothetical protein BVY03_01925 [bacterium K02(2017)]
MSTRAFQVSVLIGGMAAVTAPPAALSRSVRINHPQGVKTSPSSFDGNQRVDTNNNPTHVPTSIAISPQKVISEGSRISHINGDRYESVPNDAIRIRSGRHQASQRDGMFAERDVASLIDQNVIEEAVTEGEANKERVKYNFDKRHKLVSHLLKRLSDPNDKYAKIMAVKGLLKLELISREQFMGHLLRKSVTYITKALKQEQLRLIPLINENRANSKARSKARSMARTLNALDDTLPFLRGNSVDPLIGSGALLIKVPEVSVEDTPIENELSDLEKWGEKVHDDYLKRLAEEDKKLADGMQLSLDQYLASISTEAQPEPWEDGGEYDYLELEFQGPEYDSFQSTSRFARAK